MGCERAPGRCVGCLALHLEDSTHVLRRGTLALGIGTCTQCALAHSASLPGRSESRFCDVHVSQCGLTHVHDMERTPLGWPATTSCVRRVSSVRVASGREPPAPTRHPLTAMMPIVDGVRSSPSQRFVSIIMHQEPAAGHSWSSRGDHSTAAPPHPTRNTPRLFPAGLV